VYAVSLDSSLLRLQTEYDALMAAKRYNEAKGVDKAMRILRRLVRDVGERLFVGEVVALDASAGIDVGGLLESAGEFEQGDAFAEEDAVLPVKAGPVVVFRHLEGKVQGRFVC